MPFLSCRAFVCASIALLVSSSEAANPLFGLALIHNAPAQVALATFNPLNGSASVIGPAHHAMFGEGDLVTTAHGALYYLGEAAGRGAVLVGLNLTTGDKVCEVEVDVAEIKFVGIGQSLDYDTKTDTLVLSGIASSLNGSHAVYRSPAAGCSPLKHVGNFGYANTAPMLHASAFDADGQRLFVTLSNVQKQSLIGIVDLSPGGTMSVVAEGVTPDLHDSLLSMHYDKVTNRVLGVVASTVLQLHSLDPTGTGKWEPAMPIQAVPAAWTALGGNMATVSAFDASKRSLYLMAGTSDPKAGTESFDLATIEVDAAVVVAHPPLPSIGIKGCMPGECVEALTV